MVVAVLWLNGSAGFDARCGDRKSGDPLSWSEKGRINFVNGLDGPPSLRSQPDLSGEKAPHVERPRLTRAERLRRPGGEQLRPHPLAVDKGVHLRVAREQERTRGWKVAPGESLMEKGIEAALGGTQA